MYYNEFKGIRLPALGVGAMRLPTVDGDDGKINEDEAFAMVDYAMANGSNYFDTGWGYHSGQSETFLGKALKKYPRDSFYIADKFPGYDLSNMDKAESIFPEQLKRCGVSYFDFYLFHNVCELNIDAYLDPEYGVFEYLLKQKKEGKIHHLGFSSHGSYEVMKRFLEAYGEYMEFCQIQLNYLDWEFQKANMKVELLKEYGIPVWVMEPLRGGKLASLNKEDEAELKKLRPEETVPGWAFRFLQTVPVVITLSGMSNLDQMKANFATYEERRPLSDKEMEVLFSVAKKMVEKIVLPCTSCRYCTSHCPKGLDIPMLLNLYNEHSFTDGGFIAPMAMVAIPEEKRPSACVGCRSCEEVCPQQIKISEAMADFTAKLG